MFLRALFLLLAAGLVGGQAVAEVSGPPTVIDGDSIEIAGNRYRLHGIDAPEPGERCRKANGTSFDCGRIARTALLDLTAGLDVVCRPEAEPASGKDGRPASCSAGGFSLNRNMVHTGWAVAVPAVAAALVPVEQEARAKQRGLWRYQIAAPPWPAPGD